MDFPPFFEILKKRLEFPDASLTVLCFIADIQIVFLRKGCDGFEQHRRSIHRTPYSFLHAMPGSPLPEVQVFLRERSD